MSRRQVLWSAFAVVHALVAWLGFALHNEPMGDVYRVYEPWSTAALTGEGLVGIDAEWVYPQLALIPMILAHAFGWIAGYTVGWAVLVTAMDAVAFAVLVGRARSAGRVRAAWFWLAFIALLGPVGMYRIDGFLVPIVIIACLWLVGRPWAASMLLAVTTWMKVWPAAVLAAALIATRRRGALVGGAAIVTVFTLAVIVAAGGHPFGFIAGQTGRGLQVEAPVSAFYLWGALAGAPGFEVVYDSDLLTFQVDGPGVDAVAAAMTPLLAVAVAATAVIGVVLVRRGIRYATLMPTLALALVTAFVALNKVGSPQFQTWLVPPIVLGIVLARRHWTGPALLALAAAATTQLVYPVMYHGVLTPMIGPVALLTGRNLAVLVLFVWMLVRLVRLVRTPIPARVAG